MKEIIFTKNLFLWCMSIIYLSAFSSLYVQIPGLYGDDGILPARGIVSIEAGAKVVHQKAKEFPTLLWLAPLLGINVPLMMDVLALLGIIISFCAMIWGRMRDMTNFTLLWMLYFSLYQVGQTFLYFQWDALLLEIGFLTIFVAPFGFLQTYEQNGFLPSLPSRPHDNITLWLIRWLLFRFMFASGVVKLTSMCPTWWGLTALHYHFESQCIPTPLAYYAHYLPKWFLKLGVVGTFVIEIPIPFLFFSPIRSLRLFSFYSQVFFQILIILTGNFNFFNFLTLVMCLSLVDDEYLLSSNVHPIIKNEGYFFLKYITKFIIYIVENLVIIGIIYFTIKYFSLSILSDWTIDSKIAFSSIQFKNMLSEIMPVSICIGIISLSANIILAFYKSFNEPKLFMKFYSSVGTLLVSCIAIWLFIISLVPYSVLDNKTQNNLWPVIRRWHRNVDEFQISNSYGLFRRMTGIDGRPEIVIEGSNTLNSGWKEYHFLYKPGDLNKCPPILVPHQPRLDWQMWFAALGSYEHNPWFVSFIYRLLQGEKTVLDLLDKQRLPFPINRPPKYIRAILYTYHYAPLSNSKKNSDAWWTRRKVREYFTTVDINISQLKDHLNSAGILVDKTRLLRITNTFLKKCLVFIRSYIGSIQPTSFIWSLIATGISINFFSSLMRIY